MAASYVSARFEKTDLSTSLGKARCIVRNVDEGGVPPNPSTSYFPTVPDALRNCFLIEYVNDTVGERFSDVAALGDIGVTPVRALNAFEVPGADFLAAGVLVGDVLELFPPNTLEWQSEEYPAAPFYFSIVNVVSAERLELSVPIPSFRPNMTWAIAGKASGIQNGFPRRTGFPAVSSTFLDQRFNALFTDIATLETFVVAVKAGLDFLSTNATSSALSSENYTSRG